MKKTIFLHAACALFFGINANAQLQDEKNVTITMDLQPILQLNMQGPDQIDFTFDQIYQYYGGITKYGATTLKVSASVSFDLWAAGLSQAQLGTNFMWDNPVNYGGAAGGNVLNGANNFIPVSALELRQFPANPAVAATCATTGAQNSDYSKAFQAATAAGVAASNNDVFAANPTTPYTSPTSVAGVTSDKYIAGGTGVGTFAAPCGIAGGSYLTQAALGTSNYYYIMDYRLVPGLPATFPFHNNAATDRAFGGTGATINFGSPGNVAVAAAQGATGLGKTGGNNFAQPGVYTMYVKYILAEDQ
ncbi:MAG: hypothetical protein HY063_14760 [Bacteroidetes bacterium]|nr:hypothetical protein [Bacteroidota bacterium]